MIGTVVSHYRILEKLGVGGLGTVYKAEDTKARSTVALKFLPPDLTRNSEAKERFIADARAASAVNHPNVCNIQKTVETDDGRMFIVMACYEGETLREVIERGPLELGEAVELAIDITRGVAAMHAKGILHLDVTPANVFLTKAGPVKVVDFLAKWTGLTNLSPTAPSWCEVAYLSPEQVRGEEPDPRSDVWSMGAVLYTMTAGQPPYPGPYQQAVTYAILNQEPNPVSSLRPDAPGELVRVIAQALDKNPEARYQTLEAMLDDLLALQRSIDT